jgi:hypothetical protein
MARKGGRPEGDERAHDKLDHDLLYLACLAVTVSGLLDRELVVDEAKDVLNEYVCRAIVLDI